MYKRIRFYLLALLSLISISACNSKTLTRTIAKSSTEETAQMTSECQLKKEICDDAIDFQKEYNRMPDKQKKEMTAVLNSYIEHCKNATNACKKSIRNR